MIANGEPREDVLLRIKYSRLLKISSCWLITVNKILQGGETAQGKGIRKPRNDFFAKEIKGLSMVSL